MKSPRVLLADGNLIVETIKKLLEPEFNVIATVSDGLALVREARRLKPDVIVTDIAMPLLSGLEAGKKIKAELPRIKIIYLTMNDDPHVTAEAFEIGASEFLLKNCASSDLRAAIRHCVVGRSYRSHLLPTQSSSTDSGQPVRDTSKDSITPRQREVLRLLAEGRSMKQVAFALDLSTRTVAFHKYRMMAGLNLRSNAELIRFAMANLIV